MTPKIILQNELNNPNIPTAKQFQKWVDDVFQHVENHIPENVIEVCIRIVDDKESSELNENFCQKTGPTNVLSFSNEAEFEPEEQSLGDIAICAELVALEAKEQDIPLEHHWAHLTVHGILHLLGFDHMNDKDADEMESLEIKILHSLKVDNPYQEPLDD